MPAVDVVEDFASFREYKTWYRVIGDLKSVKVPLVAVHGGPGCTHDYLESISDIAATGRAVVFYDQIGNGRSTHLPEAGPDFWTVDLFLEELDNLLDHLAFVSATIFWASPGAACLDPSTPCASRKG